MKDHRTQNIICKESEISSLLSEKFDIEKIIINKFQTSITNLQKCDQLQEKEKKRDFNTHVLAFETKHAHIQNQIEPLEIFPLNKPVKVIAIDVSNVKLGVIADKILTAYRGCIVWKENNKKYNFYRYGPLLIPINQLNITCDKEWYNNQTSRTFMNLQEISVVRNKIERLIQKVIVNVFKNSIILFDGSLTQSTSDDPQELKEVINAARENNNSIIGISKDTNIFTDQRKITELIEINRKPCIINLDNNFSLKFSSYPMQILGRVYVVKLSKKGFTFRLDANTRGGIETDIEAVRLLIGNDLCNHGYPETLRLAHILSAFTSNEILGIERYLALHYKVKMKNEFNIRRILFGPFNS